MSCHDAPSSRGPLLRALVRAQEADQAALTFPRIEEFAMALASRCNELDAPLVWPVGDSAERLAGAAVLATEGEVRVRGWTGFPPGERILLLAVAAVGPSSLIEAALLARRMGASEIHACGVDVVGMDAALVDERFDTYGSLARELVAA